MALETQFPRSSYKLVKIALFFSRASLGTPGDLFLQPDDEMRALRTRAVLVRLLTGPDPGEREPEPSPITNWVFGHGVPA